MFTKDTTIMPDRTSVFSENCVIEQSILHYLDLRYPVCLYTYSKYELHIDITNFDSTEFKEPYGQGHYAKIQIRQPDIDATQIVEHRLIIGEVEHVLSQTITHNSPFDELFGGGMWPLFYPDDFVVDPDMRLIIIYPQPPSLAIPWDDEVRYWGFYDYGNEPFSESQLNKLDGGNKDMFYPMWCRNMVSNPLWRAQADRRYNISWWHDDLQEETNYTPDPPTVNPLPLGSYAKHPEVGELYQFLVGNDVVATSPALEALINKALAAYQGTNPDPITTHDTTLYYPISLV
jgi:hypothetical protein